MLIWICQRSGSSKGVSASHTLLTLQETFPAGGRRVLLVLPSSLLSESLDFCLWLLGHPFCFLASCGPRVLVLDMCRSVCTAWDASCIMVAWTGELLRNPLLRSGYVLVLLGDVVPCLQLEMPGAVLIVGYAFL